MKNQGQTTFFVVCLLAAANFAMAAGGKGHAPLGAAAGASGGKGHAPLGAAASASGGTQSGRGGGSGRHDARLDARNAPALAPDRKVSEQDCRKPVDLSAGNLKCK